MSNIARVVMHWRLGDTRHVYSICHVKSVDSHDPYDEADLLAIALGVDAWWWSGSQAPARHGRAFYTTQVVLVDVEVTRIRPTEGDPYVFAVGVAGTATSWSLRFASYIALPLPPQICWLVGLRTQVDTRRGRGRVYFPATWVYSSLFDDEDLELARLSRGEIDPATREDFALCMGTLAAEIYAAGTTAGEYVWAVYSAVADDSYAVTHFELADHFRTQRRRTANPGTRTAYGLSGEPA